MLLAVVLVLVALVAGLQWWLKSGIGRGLVETRLSAALGRPVRLAGDFSVGLLPLPGAGGTDLLVYSRDGRWTVASAGQYKVSMSPGPLLRGEIEIVALRIGAATLDAGRLANESTPAGVSSSPFSNIPDIRVFELESTSLYLGDPRDPLQVQIERLSLESFAVDSEAPFELELAIVTAGSEMLRLEGEGQLTIEGSGIAEVALSGLSLAYDDWVMRNATGRVTADLVQAGMAVSLESRSGKLPFRLSVEADWAPRFVTADQGLAIENLVFDLAGERIAGSGCLLNRTPPQLHIMLESDALNLASLAQLAENLRGAPSAPGAGPGGEDTVQSPAAGIELPFELSLAANVAHADFEGVMAKGVRLTAGGVPDCPDIQ